MRSEETDFRRWDAHQDSGAEPEGLDIFSTCCERHWENSFAPAHSTQHRRNGSAGLTLYLWFVTHLGKQLPLQFEGTYVRCSEKRSYWARATQCYNGYKGHWSQFSHCQRFQPGTMWDVTLSIRRSLEREASKVLVALFILFLFSSFQMGNWDRTCFRFLSRRWRRQLGSTSVVWRILRMSRRNWTRWRTMW